MINGDAVRLPFFLWRVSVITLLSLSSLSCRQRENRIVFYEDGKTVKIASEYLDNKKDGVERVYHINGRIRSETHWVDGKREGIVKEFYRNGKIGAIRNYHNNLRVGKTELFDESGRRLENQYFDSVGRIVDFKKFDRNGEQIKNIILPLPWIKKDTVELGDTVKFDLILGNVSDLRYNSGTLLWGYEFKFNAKGRPDYLKDTVGFFKSEVNFYEGKIIAKTKGSHFICAQVYFDSKNFSSGDTVDTFSVELPYFVK